MAKEKYRSVRFRGDSLTKIRQMNDIIDEYTEQGLRLTARQLYYQFVSRDLIPNQPSEYKKLTALLTDARYAGMVDWDAIEDRGREPSIPNEWNDLNHRVESALNNYRLPRWRNQKRYAELWVEKQALAGVLAPLAYQHHVPLMVNKGYSSASAMKESAERIKTACNYDEELVQEWNEQIRDAREEEGEESSEYAAVVENIKQEMKRKFRHATVLYLGDHDPSGEDMVRDIRERLGEFGVFLLTVEKVALTTAQVRQYNPPPNAAKITDPRAKKYIALHGDSSWEVDALPPNVLAQLIRRAFNQIIDKDALQEVLDQEIEDKEKLKKAMENLAS